MKGATYRVNKYALKVATPQYLSDLTTQEAAMKVNFANATTMMSANDQQVKQTCDASGVPTIQYPFYLAFGRQMWKATAVNQFSGESMAQLAAVYIAKWTARGLTQAVLQSIRTDVFNVGAPIAP